MILLKGGGVGLNCTRFDNTLKYIQLFTLISIGLIVLGITGLNLMWKGIEVISTLCQYLNNLL